MVVVVSNMTMNINRSMILVRLGNQGVISLNASIAALLFMDLYSVQVSSAGSSDQIPSDNEIVAGRDVGKKGNSRVESQ